MGLVELETIKSGILMNMYIYMQIQAFEESEEK
jgi:hypothetical protein